MKRSLLVCLYGDSLSLPRPSDGIRHFETYPELLRDALETIHFDCRVALYNRSKGGVPISDLYKQYVHDSPYFRNDSPAILLIQCGIVDCAPRPLQPAVRDTISRLPILLRWPITKVLHYARPFLLRAGFSWRATEIERFRIVLTRWLSEARTQFDHVYVFNVARTVETI